MVVLGGGDGISVCTDRFAGISIGGLLQGSIGIGSCINEMFCVGDVLVIMDGSWSGCGTGTGRLNEHDIDVTEIELSLSYSLS